ncbi:MAG TPA: GNAT family N-acetyltransferase [Mucilaginibacter sp.]|jgi:ribosomal protein S18 acetylase RimI-like enzyme|nr:GNAT family N-acetyltransferase [Mucilaginibacter sp.]
MKHVLDSPAWNALISGNKDLAFGNGPVRYFDKEVSPFVGLEEKKPENFQLLYEQLPHDGPVLFLTAEQTEIPAQWKVLQVIRGLQMVCDIVKAEDSELIELVPLTHEHAPQMVALAKLTNPGPFANETIRFGHYMGIFENGQLVAMAGQRMHAFAYAEVSAVCTHPDHTGKGYARQLLVHHINRIKKASETPFLHVRHDNERAIEVYKRLGFYTRREVYFNVMLKAG